MVLAQPHSEKDSRLLLWRSPFYGKSLAVYSIGELEG